MRIEVIVLVAAPLSASNPLVQQYFSAWCEVACALEYLHRGTLRVDMAVNSAADTVTSVLHDAVIGR